MSHRAWQRRHLREARTRQFPITKQTHRVPTSSNQITYAKGNPAESVRAAPQAVFPQLSPRLGAASVKNVPSCLAKAASTLEAPSPPYLNYQTNPPRPNQLKSNHLRYRARAPRRNQGPPARRRKVPKFGSPWDILGHWPQAKQDARADGRKKYQTNPAGRPTPLSSATAQPIIGSTAQRINGSTSRSSHKPSTYF